MKKGASFTSLLMSQVDNYCVVATFHSLFIEESDTNTKSHNLYTRAW